ncbi:metal-dependent phosphohydrolase [Bacillus sp. FJAT-27225]|uniref:HD-GYP domain-containing protein n=1 Tax=Bacillus sp. FJAT-27225 TaxID=1743144 RepID=UPI00080C264C|nr:HD-GYP domain-containing protein [Bacillus sp. FJAT-27225]OCA83058.1 metal-dependent phosphohydrolase [Bacillus sp. FJAT-27225]
MQKQVYRSILNEEERSLKWFIALFYIISLGFDLFYDFVMPKLSQDINIDDVMGYTVYIILLLLIPIAWYLFRTGRSYYVKYIYFITYTVLSLLNDVLTFFGNDAELRSGNPVEIFWLLLAPIFVSSPFFFTVLLGLTAKYLLLGIILQEANAIFGLAMVGVIAIFSFIIMSRFQAYVNAVKSSYDIQLIGIVKGVISTLELKDPYTRGHSERVASYAQILAKELGKFSKDELKMFNYACLLHDIGKVHIPDNILMKPTALTKEEYEIIKTHPVVGEKAVANVEGLSSSISVIRSHHERWDGKGYPDQLKGKEIPYLARISSIADAFDAMTSSRSYRAALSTEEAYNSIIQGSGSQFDPELVEAFKRVYPLWKKVHEEWNSKPMSQFSNFNIS